MCKHHLTTLGLNDDASPEDIDKRYGELLRRYMNNKEEQEKIEKAYQELLCNFSFNRISESEKQLFHWHDMFKTLWDYKEIPLLLLGSLALITAVTIIVCVK